MRIIAGKHKGRKFTPKADKWPTRPTTDYAREALFNILTNRLDFEELIALDLFGGAGGHSFELISRGCEDVTYIDKFAPCISFVEETIKKLKEENSINIIRADVFKYLDKVNQKFDFIFADPPYSLPKLPMLPEIIFEKELLNENGLFILEHDRNNSFEKHPNFVEERKYGGSYFSFFE